MMCGGYKDGDGIEIPDPVYFNPLFVEVQKDGIGQVVGKKRAAEGIAGIFEGVKRVVVQKPGGLDGPVDRRAGCPLAA